MAQVLLCGVAHDVQRLMSQSRLMNAYSQACFDREIVPIVTDETVIFSEGWYGVDSSGSSSYEKNLRDLSPLLVERSAKPLLVGVDPRVRMPTRKQQRMINHLFEAIRAESHLRFAKPPPERLGELVPSITTPIACELHSALSTIQKQSIRMSQKHVQRFDASYRSEIERRVKMHDRCIVIAGLAHCLRLHVLTGWGLRLLVEDSPHLAKNFFLIYFANYLWDV